MRELTIGEIRYIGEAADGWKMTVNSVLSYMDDVPAELKKNLDALADEYVEAFSEYYKNTEGTDADDIRAEFDEKWVEKHPDFYDFRKLFSACGEEQLKKAEDVFAYLENA